MRHLYITGLLVLFFIGFSTRVNALCTAPSVQASNVSIASITNSGAVITVTRGNGDGRVVYISKDNVFFTPVTGKIPVANTVYSSGMQCIYNGTGTGSGTTFTVTVSGLTFPGTYYVRAFEYCSADKVYQGATSTNNPRSFTTVCPASTAPTTITGVSSVCSTGSVTLSASGGTLASTAAVQWFEGTCGSTVLFTGNPFTVTPTATTTYYARYSNGCSTTTCVSKTITVNNKPATPVILANRPTVLCSGDSVTLSDTTSGVSSYLWSNGKTTSSIVAKTQASYALTITASNGCTSTSAPVSVYTGSSLYKPEVVRGITTICEGVNASLTASGGTLNAGGSVQWFTGSCGGNLVFTGNPFQPSPITTTTYYARYSGGCDCIAATVSVKPRPAPPVISAALGAPSPGTLTYVNNVATFEAGNSVVLSVPNSYSTYSWSNGNTAATTTQLYTPGIVSVEVANAAGCKNSASVTLLNNYYNQQRIDSINNFCSGGGYDENTTGFATLSACDDCFISVALPFIFRFKDASGLDNSFSSVYVNNNGSLSLLAGISTYSTAAFGTSTLPPFLIAPFSADVDTRTTNAVKYFIGPNYFIATWDSVGYFNSKKDKTNSFQIILTDGKGKDPFLPAGANILVRYGNINWAAGDANAGDWPKAGYDYGNLVNYFNIPGSNSVAMLNRDNSCYVFPNTSYNAAPVITTSLSKDTLVIPFGATDSVQFTISNADAGQTVYSAFDLSELCNTTVTNSNGSTATAKAVIKGDACNVGTHRLRLTAQDNFANGSKIAVKDITVIVNPGTALNLNLVLFLQGYYSGSGTMQPVMLNTGMGSNPLLTDSIVVELRDPVDPVNVMYSATVALMTNGQAQLQLPYTFKDKSLYLCIRSRNSLETWSKQPVLIGTNTTFDFAH